MKTDFEAAAAAIARWRIGKEPVSESAWELSECVWEGSRIGPIDTVLEIGTHDGNSLRVWRDAWKPSCLIGVEYEDSERTRAGLAEFAATGAHIIFGASDSWATWAGVKSALNGRGIDFLYIDGDHTMPTAKRDFYMYAPLVRPGGLIVMDDCTSTWNTTVEVYKLVPEIAAVFKTKVLSGRMDMTNDDIAGGKLIVYAPDFLTTRDEGLNTPRHTATS